MVSVKILEKKENKLKVLISGINTTIANTIRRSSYEIPVIAIDIIEFYKNDSALYDEILAHRLGLIPIICDFTLIPRKECSCRGKGCAKCTAKLKLEAKGPKMVYTRELKGRGIYSIYNMPLVWLEKDQELKFIAEATAGKATEHVKFSPGLVYYKQLPLLKNSSNNEKCINTCPKKALKIENKTLVVTEECDFCGKCMEMCKDLKIEPSEEEFIFTIESWGQIKPKEILVKSLEMINKNLKQIKKILK